MTSSPGCQAGEEASDGHSFDRFIAGVEDPGGTAMALR